MCEWGDTLTITQMTVVGEEHSFDLPQPPMQFKSTKPQETLLQQKGQGGVFGRTQRANVASWKSDPSKQGGVLPLGGAFFRLCPKVAPAFTVNCYGSLGKDGDKITLWNDSTHDNSFFQVADVQGDYFRLVPKHAPTKAMTCKSAEGAAGSRYDPLVLLANKSGSNGDNSLFKVVDVQDGGRYFRLSPKHAPGTYISHLGADVQPGTECILLDAGSDNSLLRVVLHPLHVDWENVGSEGKQEEEEEDNEDGSKDGIHTPPLLDRYNASNTPPLLEHGGIEHVDAEWPGDVQMATPSASCPELPLLVRPQPPY
jgi:hypothetical protein